MGLELIPQLSVISVLEEVIQQHGNRIEDVANLVSRNTDEACNDLTFFVLPCF